MAAPNLLSPTTITGKTTYVALSTTNATSVLSNAASSGKVMKVNSLVVSNVDGTNAASITVSRADLAACSNGVRGVFSGGQGGSGRQNVIDYITIETTGNATDFGDLTETRQGLAACSGFFG